MHTSIFQFEQSWSNRPCFHSNEGLLLSGWLTWLSLGRELLSTKMGPHTFLHFEWPIQWTSRDTQCYTLENSLLLLVLKWDWSQVCPIKWPLLQFQHKTSMAEGLLANMFSHFVFASTRWFEGSMPSTQYRRCSTYLSALSSATPLSNFYSHKFRFDV